MSRLLTYLFHDVYETDPSSSGFSGAAADRYKLRLRDFEEQLEALASARVDEPVLVVRAPQNVNTTIPFAITFDDGGVSFHTTIAERLERFGWRGHFFVTTDYIGDRRFLDADQIRDLDRRGHVVGTHSASHPARLSYRAWDDIVGEWRRSRETLEGILEHEVKVGSVPGGYFSPTVARAATAAGIDVLFTSEPEITIRRIHLCSVLGRFTVRRDHRPDFTRRLGALETGVRAKEWIRWNARKLIKTAFVDRFRSGAKRTTQKPTLRQ